MYWGQRILEVYRKRDTSTDTVLNRKYFYGQYILNLEWNYRSKIEMINLNVVGIKGYSSVRSHDPQS